MPVLVGQDGSTLSIKIEIEIERGVMLWLLAWKQRAGAGSRVGHDDGSRLDELTL
jgi:hypothetical protein